MATDWLGLALSLWFRLDNHVVAQLAIVCRYYHTVDLPCSCISQLCQLPKSSIL